MNPKIKVISSGKYIPELIITNEDMAKLVDTSSDWIVSRTGILRRHKAVNEESSDLAYKAAMQAIEKVKYDKDKIDLIVIATITGDQMTPSTANIVQGKLGLNHQVMSFDINAACTGFIYGLEIASAMLASRKFRSALVIGSEKLTKIVDYTDRNTCVLFGDGAGAVIIEPSDNPMDETFFYNAAKSDLNQSLTVEKYIKMDGKKVYIFAVDIMEKSIKKILKDANLTMDDIDCIIPHQANERIIQAVSKSMGIPMEKFILNLSEYGNTSAASIPITIDEYLEHAPKKARKILLVGFGGGFTWGSAIINV
ncbi:MAG: ketoacyl-ACP synthase III [Acholeplasmataceae bacterium]|nr:ketoacyl-ACP synthase III [Acholeplasmataceae bacterium]